MIKLIPLSVISCLLLTTVNAQTNRVAKPNATVDLILKNSPKQKFILRSSSQSNRYDIVDSAMLGEKGSVDSLHFELFVIGRESHLNLVFQKKNLGLCMPVIAPGDHLKIIADISDPTNIQYSGSATTAEFNEFLKENKSIGSDYLKYKLALNAKGPDSTLMKYKIDSINSLKAAFFRKIIFKTNCAFVVVFALIGSQNGVVNYTDGELTILKEKFKDDEPALMQIGINEKLQTHPINTKPKPANGSYLAGFTLPDGQGQQVNLVQFKGKYVLLDFWASWCVPCRMESPYLKKAIQEFGKDKLVILSVSIDENHEDWKKAIAQDGTQAFVHLIDDRGKKSPVKNQYNIESIPSNFLLDPTGKILEKDLRGEKLLAKISEVIQKRQ